MDDDLGLDFLEDVADGGGGGYVGRVIGCIWEAVMSGAEVEDGDFGGGGFEELAHDVVAEETAAADYEDGGGHFWRGLVGGHCRIIVKSVLVKECTDWEFTKCSGILDLYNA